MCIDTLFHKIAVGMNANGMGVTFEGARFFGSVLVARAVLPLTTGYSPQIAAALQNDVAWVAAMLGLSVAFRFFGGVIWVAVSRR